MEPFLRRVYLTVGGVLVILWLGLLAWVIGVLNPDFSFFFPGSFTQEKKAENISRDYHIPGNPISVHTTIPGETFSSLALKYNLSENTLRSLNQANDKSEPQTDSVILIPSKEGIYHIVRQGQGLADIARAYKIPLKEILKANLKRGDSDLQPNDILYLPGASYLRVQDPNWGSLAALEAKKGFLKPTTGRFADGFGERLHPLTHKMTFHEGLDLAPGWGARVVASQRGKIIFAGIRAGYGRLIIIDHGSGLTSWYAHLDQILVKVQGEVERGDLIGKVGKTGRTTGPHLHFEVRLNGKPKNPFLYLSQ